MNKQRVQTVKFNSTTMVQEIVAVLKNPPFNQAMTLLTFEEKKEREDKCECQYIQLFSPLN